MRDRAVAAINAQLARLRLVLDRLTPGEDILKPKKFLGIFGRSNPILTYFDRYLSSEAEIEAALSTIMESRDMLFRDNRSEEHTSELQSLMRISYAVFCLKKKNAYTLAYKTTHLTFTTYTNTRQSYTVHKN